MSGLQELLNKIDDARYAMVDSNIEEKSVPPSVIDNWLHRIEIFARELEE